MIQVYISDKSIFPPRFEDKELLLLHDAILGDIEKCTPNKPAVQDGMLSGGTAFGRCEHCSFPVKRDTHCYQYMTLTTQKVRNLTSPNINSKAPLDEGRAIQEHMLKVRQPNFTPTMLKKKT